MPELWVAVGIRDFPGALQDSPAIVRLGNHAVVRFEEQVTDGRLVLRFHGDETTYRREVERLKLITDERVKRQSMYSAGGPFTKNSVLSVVVLPAIPKPLVLKDGKLEAANDRAETLHAFVRAFNAEDFRAANQAIRSLPSETFEEQHARILARMWLVGHPNHWREREMLPRLLTEIDAARSQDGLSDAARAELDSLRRMVVDMQRGAMNFDQRTKERQEVVTSMNRAEGDFARALPGDPFYWKSKLYQARIWYSMDPNRNAQLWRHSEQIMRELATVYPNNRWVRYYVHDDPSGWALTDYREQTKDAPAWASEVHNFYNRTLDLCEWWIANRQNADNGALGGEWGDDVEFMPLITYTSVVCPDASPLLVEGTMRFADGAWKQSGIIDEHNGFFHLTSDAEHAAEFTGNVLGMMLHARPGDPEYVERSMKTGKLMRDIWMGRNARGHRLVRSSFLGAFHVPNTGTDSDSAICGRAMNPAWNVLALNRNPEIARLAIEYADTLVELALSTEKGKPRGVLPGPVVFETGEFGTRDSQEWWLAPPGSFQGMFSFPDYHGFRLQILTIAWRLTGDESYLEPIRLEAELIEEHYPPSQRDEDRRQQAALAKARPEVRTEARRREDDYRFGPEAGTLAWTARLLSPMGVLEYWDDLQWEMKGAEPESKGILLNKDEVAREARKVSDVARHRWPIMTDDATMTDRVGFTGCANSTVWYSGGRFVSQQLLPAFTWEGAGRDFAALALRHNSRYAKLLYYGFQDTPRDITLRFWDLEPQGTYRLTGGPDANGDDVPDELAIDEQFVLNEPSGGVTMPLPPGRTFVLEIKQTARGQSEVHVPDPAIAARDIRFDLRGHLLVDVHNIGNLAAENVEVKFYEGNPADGGKLIGRTIVSYIEAPNTLEPQIVRTGIEWSPTADNATITVVLDESNQIDELFERNNRATTVIERHVAD
ncbi:MAG: CARDB domain-containing protein [Planctomycetaceae bacterium]